MPEKRFFFGWVGTTYTLQDVLDNEYPKLSCISLKQTVRTCTIHAFHVIDIV